MRADADTYFARQDTNEDVRALEDFQARHSDQMARNALPCETDPVLKLQVGRLPSSSLTISLLFGDCTC